MAVNREALLKKYGASEAAPSRGPSMGGPGRRNNKYIAARGKPKNLLSSVMRLFSYMGKDRYKLILAVVSAIVSAVTLLGGSYLIRPVLNAVVDGTVPAAEKIDALLNGLLVMFVLYIVGVATAYSRSYFMLHAGQNAIVRIRENLFARLERLPVRYYDTHSHGEIMSRFTNDIDAIGELVNNTLVQFITGIMSIAITLFLMLYTNLILSAVVLLMMPVIVMAGRFIGGRSRRYYRGQQTALGALNGYIEEMVTGQKVVKVFNHESVATEEFDELSGFLRERQMDAQFFGGIMGPVVGNLSQVCYGIVAAVGGILCITSGFDIGGLTVFTNYARQFSRPINELSMQMNTVFAALAGAERVFDVMDQPPEAEDKENAVAPEKVDGYVRLEHVTFSYDPGHVILKDVSCYARPGQKIAFVGSTGAGKTTVTNLLNRFYDIEEGTITLDDIDIKDYRRDFLRKNIAMVLQDTHLFTGTVMENIRYGRPDATDEEVREAARMACADGFIRRLKHGYDTMLEGDGTNLSQGQRQLLNIARAAISKAPVLILDEATSSVDTRTERLIEKGMDTLMSTRTTFVIAHRLSTVRNSNAIMVLEHGEIIERGTHEQLLELKGRYYELYTGKAELD